MATLTDIEQHTRCYADARDLLASRVQALQDEIEAAKRRKLFGIKKAVAAAAEARDKLHAAIEDSPELFERPRTLVILGIRIGYTKGSGKLSFDDASKVVQLIRRHFPEQSEVLVKTTEAPSARHWAISLWPS